MLGTNAKRAGFTLIELLVVVVIIGILASVSVSAFRDAQDRARNSSMMSNVRAVQVGIEQWRTDYQGLPTELVSKGKKDPSKYIAASSPSDISSWPTKYVPGGEIPRSPWASVPQHDTDSEGLWYSCQQNQPPQDGSLAKRLLIDNQGVASLLTPVASDGVSDGVVPPPGKGPDNFDNYGYMYYVGEPSSSRYCIFGRGKLKEQGVIVAIKTNF